MPAPGGLAPQLSAPAMPSRLPSRLHRPADIREVFAAGAHARTGGVTVHLRMRADEGAARAAVVAGRSLGGAVDRNRAKRRLRAALGDLGLPAAVDAVLVARPPALRLPYARLCAELRTALAQAGAQARARAGAR